MANKHIGTVKDYKEAMILIVIIFLAGFMNWLPVQITVAGVIAALVVGLFVSMYLNKVKGGASVSGKLLPTALAMGMAFVLFSALYVWILQQF